MHGAMTFIFSNMSADFYTPESDILLIGEDGRATVLAPAGVAIPMHIARAKGFVKDDLSVNPAEAKAQAEAEAKAQAEAEAKAQAEAEAKAQAEAEAKAQAKPKK